MPARAQSPILSGDDVRALGVLAAEAGAGIARLCGEVDAAVADRAFSALQRARLPVGAVRRAHELIAGGSHTGARVLTAGILRAAGAGAAATRPAAARSLHADPRGVVIQGVLAGAWGDRLRADGSPLAPQFALLVDDRRPVTGRLVVFVHGLGETDHAWRTPGYGDRLSARGLTPVYARYNSGAGVQAGADALAAGLDGLCDGWPVPVAEIALVGHSMGGLVIRAACHRSGLRPWAQRVAVTVALGAPYEGAPLARAAAAAERVLGALPETRPFAAPLRARSAGIRDLERGVTAPFRPGVDHYLVSASVSRDPRALPGRVLGDLLVHHRSAWAQGERTERLRFAEDHYRHLGGATHFDLLGHPAIADLLCEWVADRPARLPPVPGPALAAPPA